MFRFFLSFDLLSGIVATTPLVLLVFFCSFSNSSLSSFSFSEGTVIGTASRSQSGSLTTHQIKMARSLAIALVALVAATVSSSAAPLLQDALDAGWESRWTHSSDAKYTGRFTSSDKAGVQVRGRGEWLREREEEEREKNEKKASAPSI